MGPSQKKNVPCAPPDVREHDPEQAYDDGSRPHHVWREWLLSDENEFTEVTLTPNQAETLTWDIPLYTVRAGGGNTQWENFAPQELVGIMFTSVLRACIIESVTRK